MSTFEEVFGNVISLFDYSSYFQTPKVAETSRKPKVLSPLFIPKRTKSGNSPLPPKLSSYSTDTQESEQRQRAQSFYNSEFSEQMDQVTTFFTNIYQNLQEIVQVQNGNVTTYRESGVSMDSIDELVDISGKYELVQYLGKGAYGKVYEASDKLVI
jgi:hypothetical protein